MKVSRRRLLLPAPFFDGPLDQGRGDAGPLRIRSDRWLSRAGSFERDTFAAAASMHGYGTALLELSGCGCSGRFWSIFSRHGRAVVRIVAWDLAATCSRGKSSWARLVSSRSLRDGVDEHAPPPLLLDELLDRHLLLALRTCDRLTRFTRPRQLVAHGDWQRVLRLAQQVRRWLHLWVQRTGFA